MSELSNASSPGKKAYTTPRLVRYGDVRTLTTAGTMGGAENAGMVGPAFMASAPCVKENILRIGTHPFGMGHYLFDYKAEYRDAYGHGRQFGVMADEVEAVMPNAVSLNLRGHKVVDRGMLGIRTGIA